MKLAEVSEAVLHTSVLNVLEFGDNLMAGRTPGQNPVEVDGHFVSPMALNFYLPESLV